MIGTHISHRPPPAGQPVVALYGRPVSAAHNEAPGTRLLALASRFIPASDYFDRGIALTYALPSPLAAKALVPRHEQHASPEVEPQTVMDYALLPVMQAGIGVAGLAFGLSIMTRALRCHRWSVAMFAGFPCFAALGAGLHLMTLPKDLSSPATIIGCEIAVVASSLLAAVAFDVDDHLQRKAAKHAEHRAPNDPPDDE